MASEVFTHSLQPDLQVGRWVKADDLRLAMEREQKSIRSEEARQL